MWLAKTSAQCRITFAGHSTNSKDYEFSRATVRQLWEAGLEDVRRTCAHADWRKALKPVDGMQIYDLTR